MGAGKGYSSGGGCRASIIRQAVLSRALHVDGLRGRSLVDGGACGRGSLIGDLVGIGGRGGNSLVDHSVLAVVVVVVAMVNASTELDAEGEVEPRNTNL